MKLFLVLIAIAVVIFVLIALKKQTKKAGKRSRERISQPLVRKNQTSFQATRIIPGDNACQAAENLQNRLFLDSEINTPNLPLPECTQISDCHCKYDHQDDRRSDENDRRALHTLRSELYGNTEAVDKRGKKRGRRAPD